MSTSASGSPPTPPAEAGLIRLAREAKGLSPETAAARAQVQLGGSRWRQIEAGFRRDSDKRVEAPARTLAHMAHVVGVSPERLDDAGRGDAATILREIEAQEAAVRPAPLPEQAEPSDPDPRWRMLEASLQAAGQGLTRKERGQLRETIERYLAEHPEWQPPEPGEGSSPRRAG